MAETDMTILSAIESIVDASRFEKTAKNKKDEIYFKMDDELLLSIHPEAAFLAKEFSITEKQAVLFAIIIEVSQEEEFTVKDISRKLDISYIRFLSYEEEIHALEHAWLLRRDRWGKYYIGKDVSRCLEKNKAYKRPSVKGLSTFTILSRISRLFRNVDDGLDRYMALMEMDGMLLANPETSIAKTANKYKILRTGDAVQQVDPDESWTCEYDYSDSMSMAERFLFYAMCHKYHSNDTDECRWWYFREYFASSDLEDLQSAYKDEELELQEKKVLVYASQDGMLVKDLFKLDDSVKEEILADCGGLHESSPMAGLIQHSSLAKKDLFYDDAVSRNVDLLAGLLSESRFTSVRDALKKKGMRSGFTCLFYGAPGTGKTETVYQLARNSGRDIIMADVSKLKSMWVGESEKNLKNLFSMYRKAVKESKMTPILLFNEADAIFGVRKNGAENAVDKMENSLQNIILQEMEDLQGILIATTNLTDNLDKAFERRFLYKVRFDKPSVESRGKIWKSMFPELSDEEARQLSADYDFSGGQIENVVRKKTVRSLLLGSEPSFEDIRQYCAEEGLGDKPFRRRIGF